jgi:hypothetical protein
MDSAYYAAAAIRRGRARFSVTAPVNSAIRAAIAAIPPDAWQPIEYPQAIWDDQLGCRVSDAEVAETEYAAFTSKTDEDLHVTVRLIVRRVRDRPGRHRARASCSPPGVTTPSSPTPLTSWSRPKSSAAATPSSSSSSPISATVPSRTCPPSGKFTANAAWLATAAIAHNLLRAAGTLAGRRHARARAATIRRDLIAVASRTARRGRGSLILHLPEGWHRQHEWRNLFEAACGPSAAALDQPRPGPRPHARQGIPPQPPNPDLRTSRRTVSGRENTPPKPSPKRATGPKSVGGSRLRPPAMHVIYRLNTFKDGL